MAGQIMNVLTRNTFFHVSNKITARINRMSHLVDSVLTLFSQPVQTTKTEAMEGIGPLMSMVFKSKKKYHESLLQACTQKMAKLSDRKFRKMVQQLLMAQGYKARAIKGNNTDIVAIINNCGVLVRTVNVESNLPAKSPVEHSNNMVNIDACLQLFDDCQLIEAEAGFIFTSGKISPEAFNYCKSNSLFCLGDNDLLAAFEYHQIVNLENYAERHDIPYIIAA
jgi:hypothetical protein